MAVRRGAGHVARQLAAALDHDAEAAEGEHLDRHDVLLAEPLDLLDRQHAWQHRARDAEAFPVVAQRRVRRGGALHREMARQLGVVPCRVVEHAHVSADDRVDAERRGTIHGRLPVAEARRSRIGVERHVHQPPPGVGVGDAGAQVGLGEVQAGKRACIGLVAEADVDGVGTVVDRRDQGRRTAGGADEVHRDSAGGWARDGRPRTRVLP